MKPEDLWVSVRRRPYGPKAWLWEWPESGPELCERLWALCRLWSEKRPDGVLDFIIGQQSLLVQAQAGGDPAQLIVAVAEAFQTAPAVALRRSVEIPVRYKGPDLEAVAHALSLTVEEVAHRHQASDFYVGWMGFLPGFAYLLGLDPKLALPRRSAVRSRVAAGSVAIADAMSAVYPLASPGGWHLIGSTDWPLLARGARLAMLEPGDRVRFVAQ